MKKVIGVIVLIFTLLACSAFAANRFPVDLEPGSVVYQDSDCKITYHGTVGCCKVILKIHNASNEPLEYGVISVYAYEGETSISDGSTYFEDLQPGDSKNLTAIFSDLILSKKSFSNIEIQLD